VRRPEDDPGGLVWLIGLVSLMLPWVGAPMAAAGLVMGVKGFPDGWWLLASGLALLIGDVLLTFLWARPATSRTDQPTLNRREAQYIGRTVPVVEAIAGGEGKVRIADSVWPARGPECDAGSWVKVVGSDGGFLVVERLDARPVG
jgi:membrane protein implicated in regulation of membrane protease activity